MRLTWLEIICVWNSAPLATVNIGTVLPWGNRERIFVPSDERCSLSVCDFFFLLWTNQSVGRTAVFGGSGSSTQGKQRS